MADPKPFDAYPDKATWLADLDHTRCTQDRNGNCYGIHCVFCGASIGGGFVRCRCEGATRAWS